MVKFIGVRKLDKLIHCKREVSDICFKVILRLKRYILFFILKHIMVEKTIGY